MTESYPRLLHALNEVRAQWRRTKVLEGVLLTLAGTAAVVAALVAVDNLFQPGTGGRLALAALLWGGLALAVLSLIVKRVLEDRRDDFFAALVEQKYPQFHNGLINALQLGRDNQTGFSRDLIEAIVKDADRALVDTEPAEAVDGRPFRRAAGWALAACLLVAGYAAAFPPRFANGLARVLLPVSDIAPYTRTQIPADAVEPGDTKVAEGKPLAIRVTVRGEVPSSARVYRRPGTGSWQGNEMLPDEQKPGAFHFVVPQVGASFEYYLRAGDGRSRVFKVEVVRPPQVAKIGLTYHYPPYTGLEAKRLDSSDGEVVGVAGTAVELELTATKSLRGAELVTRGTSARAAETVALDRGEGATRTGRFLLSAPKVSFPPELAGQRVLLAPTSYQIKLEDSDGYANADPLWRSVVLKPDQPPEVVLRAPDDRLSVKADTVLPLTVDCRDDFGLAAVRVLFRVNNGEQVRELARFGHDGAPELQTRDRHEWKLDSSGLKVGDRVEYWAEATDRNNITGPGRSESKKFTLEVINPLDLVKNLDTKISDYIEELKVILKLQRQNRAETDGGVAFKGLVAREVDVRKKTSNLARNIERDGVPVTTVVQALDALAAGPMAEVVKLLESGQGTEKDSLAAEFRKNSLPVQDRIIKELEEILVRLQRNEQAKKALRRMEKKDPEGHKKTVAILSEMLKGLDQLLKDQTELAGKFERMPKDKPDEVKEEMLKALNDLDNLKKRTEKWGKGSVQEMTKMPKGFIDDFDLRKDVNKVVEEVEKAKERAKAEKIEVSLEDLGAGLGTKMKEDLEMWLPDAPDNAKWVLEEPLNKKNMKIPEMPLPKALQDLVGELLQRADEFDEDADDVTSAWGDNLDQAGWGVSDGPISTFSAKGKTGNDQPNSMELTGRSGDGRRGKSEGQMVGDTSRGLPGRPTPARVGNAKYEPGQLKNEGQEDPNGVTDGGKKAGAGRLGLQGGSAPDQVPDIGRLSAKQAGMREKMEQVARKLESQGVSSVRLKEGIELLKGADKDLADRRYDDAARKRREAMAKVRGGFGEFDTTTAAQLNKARDLPANLRNELLQSAEAGYPAGYEGLLKSYYKALSTSEK